MSAVGVIALQDTKSSFGFTTSFLFISKVLLLPLDLGNIGKTLRTIITLTL